MRPHGSGALELMSGACAVSAHLEAGHPNGPGRGRSRGGNLITRELTGGTGHAQPGDGRGAGHLEETGSSPNKHPAVLQGQALGPPGRAENKDEVELRG